MVVERVLTLDISTKTGWCLTISSDEDLFLEAYGQIPKVECPDGKYPVSFVEWAYECYYEIEKVFEAHAPDVLVIEETAANSKTSHSQKILEWIHMLVAKLIQETGIKAIYLLTGEWRKEANSKMNDAERLRNKEAAKYKKQHKSRLAYDINGKVMGKITKKHIAIRRANEVFGKYFKEPLRKKDEDLADSLIISLAYHLRRKRGLYV
jgi:hypothetical protein